MRRLPAFTFLFFSCAFCFAQTYNQDFGLITGIQLNKDLPKGFDISAQYQLRLINNITTVKGSYIYGTLQYSLIKRFLSTEFEYRYHSSPSKDQHRFGFGLNGKYKYKKVTFSDRLTYQREHEYFNSSYENGHKPSNYIRNRLQIKWGFKKRWDAYISCEPFFKISNKGNAIDRIRLLAGFNWEFRKNHLINLFGLFQPDVNQSEPDMYYSIGCIYEWDIPKFKKKSN